MDQPPHTVGSYLRRARETRRISVARAEEETKIRADYLIEMESDRMGFLAPAHVRGFVKSYAEYLRVDPVPLLAEFDLHYPHADDAPPVQREGHASRLIVMAAAVAGAVLLVVAIVGLLQRVA